MVVSEAIKNFIGSSLNPIPQTVQNSLDAFKDLTQSLQLFGMDATILIGYLLYIVLFFVAIRGIFVLFQKYKENEKFLSKLFFYGIFNREK